MSEKTIVMGATTLGTIVGGFIPMFWGGSTFSYASVLLSAVGGVIGLYVSYKMVM